MRLWLALRAFFRILFNQTSAEQARRLLLEGPPAEQPQTKAEPAKPATPAPVKPQRSDALTLLAALQREARLVDFLKEPLDGFSDAEVGAVARNVHRDCGKVVERWFGVAPILNQEDGAPVELPAGFDAGRYRLTGQVSGEPPYRGRLVHHGWEATRCETPTWTGSADAARVIAPVEVEI
jgi:hypothetical protein